MSTSQRTFTCLQCRIRSIIQPPRRLYHASARLQEGASRPSIAPKPIIDIKHIRQNQELYAQNCFERNYKLQATYPETIDTLYKEWHESQEGARSLRERNNRVR